MFDNCEYFSEIIKEIKLIIIVNNYKLNQEYNLGNMSNFFNKYEQQLREIFQKIQHLKQLNIKK